MKPMIAVSAVATAVALALLAGCNSDNQTTTTPTITEYQYSTKAVHSPAGCRPPPIQVAPAGVHVGVHRAGGAPRLAVVTLQSEISMRADQADWEQAASEGPSPLWARPWATRWIRVTAANQKMGYGLLSQRGKDEHASWPPVWPIASNPAGRRRAHCLKVETSGRIAPTRAPTTSCRA